MFDQSRNPYFSSLVKNPPPPATRPITTNLDPNPYNPVAGARLIQDSHRRSTYAPAVAPDLTPSMTNRSSFCGDLALIASATAENNFTQTQKAQPVALSRPTSKATNLGKRTRGQQSSSELSEFMDDDLSPSTQRRLKVTPAARRQRQRLRQGRAKSRGKFTDDGREGILAEVQYDEADQGTDTDEFVPLLNKKRGRNIPNRKSAQRAPTTPIASGSVVIQSTPANLRDSLRKRNSNKPVPLSMKEAGPADKMMWTWKNSGQPWDKIRDEWEKIEGTRPAPSTLSVRYIKLGENLAASGFEDEIPGEFFEAFPNKRYLKGLGEKQAKAVEQEVILLQAREEADREMRDQFWELVAKKVKEKGGRTYSAKLLSKTYEKIQKKDMLVGLCTPLKPMDKHQTWDTTECFPQSTAQSHTENSEMDDITQTPNQIIAYDDLGHNLAVFEGYSEPNLHVLLRNDIQKGKGNAFTDEVNAIMDKALMDTEMLHVENESPAHAHPQHDFSEIHRCNGFSSNTTTVTDEDRDIMPAFGKSFMHEKSSPIATVSGERLSLVNYGNDSDEDNV